MISGNSVDLYKSYERGARPVGLLSDSRSDDVETEYDRCRADVGQMCCKVIASGKNRFAQKGSGEWVFNTECGCITVWPYRLCGITVSDNGE